MVGPTRKPGKGAPPSLSESHTANTNTRTPSDAERVLFNARLPPALIKRIKVYAVENDISQQEIAEQALDAWLKQRGA